MTDQSPSHDYLFDQIKGMVLKGALARDQRIDLQALADAFRVSITPIRDVLHELIGERLVERHDLGGYQPLTPTATALQHLYAWNGQHLLAAMRLLSEPIIRQVLRPVAQSLAADLGTDSLGLMEQFSMAIGEATGNAEFARQVEAASARLRRPRLAEGRLFGDRDRELQSMIKSTGLSVQKNVRRRLLAYHRRRVEHAPQIAALIV